MSVTTGDTRTTMGECLTNVRELGEGDSVADAIAVAPCRSGGHSAGPPLPIHLKSPPSRHHPNFQPV
jgi:hypothetical protein